MVVDGRGRLPGRGAWVHVKKNCLMLLAKRPSLLHRALRQPADPGEFDARVCEWVLKGVQDGLAFARAGGALVLGHDALSQALTERKVKTVATAVDASSRTLKGLRRDAHSGVAFVEIPLTREKLGHQVGAGLLSAVGVKVSPATSLLDQRLQQWTALG